MGSSNPSSPQQRALSRQEPLTWELGRLCVRASIGTFLAALCEIAEAHCEGKGRCCSGAMRVRRDCGDTKKKKQRAPKFPFFDFESIVQGELILLMIALRFEFGRGKRGRQKNKLKIGFHHNPLFLAFNQFLNGRIDFVCALF